MISTEHFSKSFQTSASSIVNTPTFSPKFTHFVFLVRLHITLGYYYGFTFVLSYEKQHTHTHTHAHAHAHTLQMERVNYLCVCVCVIVVAYKMLILEYPRTEETWVVIYMIHEALYWDVWENRFTKVQGFCLLCRCNLVEE